MVNIFSFKIAEKRSDYFIQNASLFTGFSESQSWSILSPLENSIKVKIESIGTSLKEWDIQINYGIKTGFNEAFIIDSKTKDDLILKSPKNAEIIRPIFKGRNIKQYTAEFGDLWLINTHNGLKKNGLPRIDVINDYPTIHEFLSTYEAKLIHRLDQGDHWTNLRNCAYLDEFEKEKIIWLELTDVPKFAYDNNGAFVEATAFFMTGSSLKYLLAFLNSKLCEWYFDKITTTSGVGTNRWKKVYIEMLSIPQLSTKQQEPFINLIDRILDRKHKGEPFSDIEELLNEKIYQLYSLSQQEISVIH